MRLCCSHILKNRFSHAEVQYLSQVTHLVSRDSIKSVFGFRPDSTQTGLYSHRRWLEALNFGFRQKMDCTICVTKTKTLISCAVTAQLICAFVFAYAKADFLTTQLIFHSCSNSLRYSHNIIISFILLVGSSEGDHFSNNRREGYYRCLCRQWIEESLTRHSLSGEYSASYHQL